ncbi:MAG: (d)CMP kinase [Anaeroplasmataceae bacterium]
MNNYQIAIDGPAGSGKSSISKILAKELGFTHLDTGAMYRAITYLALKENIDLNNELEYIFLQNINMRFQGNNIIVNDIDLSQEIRSVNVTNNVSIVSKLKVVRDKLLEIQRDMSKTGFILIEGRDIGSVVLPNANVKFFLTASAEERARRRLLEFQSKKVDITFDEVLESIKQRDLIDSTREISPLIIAKDAIVIDSSNLSIDEVIEKMKNIVNTKMKES